MGALAGPPGAIGGARKWPRAAHTDGFLVHLRLKKFAFFAFLLENLAQKMQIDSDVYAVTTPEGKNFSGG